MRQIHHRAGILRKYTRRHNAKPDLQHSVADIQQEIGGGQKGVIRRGIHQDTGYGHRYEGDDAGCADADLQREPAREGTGEEVAQRVQ